MKLKGPKIIKYAFMAALYPSLYIVWVKLVKNTWIDNDIKDLHPQIIFPEAHRFTKTSSPYNHLQQYKQALVCEGKDSLRQKYLQRLEKRKRLNKSSQLNNQQSEDQNFELFELGQEYFQNVRNYFDYIYNTYTK